MQLVFKQNYTDQELTRIKDSNLYRELKTVSLHSTTNASINGIRVINLCSNDYLGISQNKNVLKETIKRLGRVSQCSSRLLAGNSEVLEELEERLAEHRGTESSLVYPTGYMANLGVISVLADKNSAIFSDEMNHASIIDGCRMTKALICVFRHNDMDNLEQLMRKFNRKTKIIITEGLFGMDGDFSRLKEICNLAIKYEAMTIVDDAHGDFIFGSQSNLFAGVPSEQKVSNMIDVHTSSLSKALGCFGGYVATTRRIRELLVNKSRQFIYTSALPSHLCTSALSAIPLAKYGNLQKRLFRNVSFFRTGLQELGFFLGESNGQIIPIVVGDEKLSLRFSQELLKSRIFAQPIRYPTVKKNSARVRLTMTSPFTKKQLATVIESFGRTARKCGVL
jgi:glycine C-acetyltransferase